MGIEAIDPFELPLINTVNCVTLLISSMAVWVKIPLYELNLNLDSYFMDHKVRRIQVFYPRATY
jgi:hypothetical protein